MSCGHMRNARQPARARLHDQARLVEEIIRQRSYVDCICVPASPALPAVSSTSGVTQSNAVIIWLIDLGAPITLSTIVPAVRNNDNTGIRLRWPLSRAIAHISR